MTKRKIETIAIQAGRNYDTENGAVMPPIHLSTTFVRGNAGDFTYSRVGNPNRQALEECLMELEGGAGAIAFGSGMAAVAGVFQSLSSGDHVVLPDDTYFGVRELVTNLLSRWGLEHTLVDMTDLLLVKAAIQPNTRLVWVETPSNPMLKITDISAVASLTHECGALLGVDGTWATPMLQPALELGADLVVHSTTKYLGGHSDLTGGVIVAEEENDVIGMSLSFPSSYHKITNTMRNYFPVDRMEHLRHFYASRVQDSWLLDALCVIESHRRQGIGEKLISLTKEKAVENGCRTLSLITFADNDLAIPFYKRTGFEIVEKVELRGNEFIKHEGGCLLMNCEFIT